MSLKVDRCALKLELCNLGMLNVIPMVTAKKIAEDTHKRKWERVETVHYISQLNTKGDGNV